MRKKAENIILKSSIFFMFLLLVLGIIEYKIVYGVENEKIAYITFDDGPSKYTSKIIDILDKNNVKATFFMINSNMIVYKDVVRRMNIEGHGTGFHSVTHDINKLYKSEDSAIEEFRTCNRTFYDITGQTSRLVRMPFGSKPYMLDNIYKKFIDEGFLVWDWTIDTEDWKSSEDQIVSNILYYAREKEQIVILLHENQRTINCLDDMIAILKGRGYTIKSITEDIKPKNFW